MFLKERCWLPGMPRLKLNDFKRKRYWLPGMHIWGCLQPGGYAAYLLLEWPASNCLSAHHLILGKISNQRGVGDKNVE